MFKKHIFAIPVLILALSLSACGGNDSLAERVADLEARNALLQAQIDDFSARLDALEAASAAAFAEMTVGGWSICGSDLTLSDIYVLVQLSGGGSPDSAKLVLARNGTESDSLAISLEPGEGLDTFALSISEIHLTLPDLVEEDYLELALEILLPGGRTVTAGGAAWYYTPEGLQSVVG